jgi:hypothetical protein
MRLALVCVGVLSAGVLAPGVSLAQGVLAPSAMDRLNGSQSATPQGPMAVSPLTSTTPSGCFAAGALTGVFTPNDRDVVIRVGRSEFYRARVRGTCAALHGAEAQVLSGPMICGPADMELKIAPTGGSVSRCEVASLRRISLSEGRAAESAKP